MRCLVTGATGFFGSHVTRLLSRRGHEVTILKRANSDSWRIADVLPDVRVVSGDLSDLASVREQLIECRPETVLHLGWQGVQGRFRNDRMQSDNIGQAAQLLAIAHQAGCRNWIGFGSQAEYGPKQEAISETEPPAPTSFYGVAKLATMEMSRAMAALLDMRWVWLRVFSLYGPADEPSWMIPSLIQQLLGREVPALTAGTQMWDYLYVEEAAEAVVQLMETPAACGLFNLGSGRALPLRQIVEEVRDIIDPSLSLGFGEIKFRSDQVMHLEADITRLQEAVAWRPRADYGTGLRATVAWHSAIYRERGCAVKTPETAELVFQSRQRGPMTNSGVTGQLALRARRHALRMIHRANSSHIGSCLSIADILAVLYADVLRVDPEQPLWPGRDRFILSKGHAAAIAYAVLAERGFFPVAWLDDYAQDGSLLTGHVSHHVPGVELSTGSLGHGLSVGCGMALSGKREGHPYRVYVLLSDGELDEGSNWEPILFAPHHRLDNLIAIVDYNKIQSFGSVAEVLDLSPLAEKWRAFQWAVREVDGHDHAALITALREVPIEAGKPTCVIAHTVKGRGVGFMEDKLAWHYRSPDATELAAALAELEAGR